MTNRKDWASFELDQDGRVVLTDEDLDGLVDAPSEAVAGGTNRPCPGFNGGCTNGDCDGSTNGSCTNTGCDRTSNGVGCLNKEDEVNS